jgi:UDP-N-acetylmuramyl pentapeptide phosphotransferase/UDP-N-acetylglucosamine-1-phosphate transferase
VELHSRLVAWQFVIINKKLTKYLNQIDKSVFFVLATTYTFWREPPAPPTTLHRLCTMLHIIYIIILLTSNTSSNNRHNIIDGVAYREGNAAPPMKASC